MKFHIYTNFNRKVECFERPLVRIEDPDEYCELVSRDFKASDDNAKTKMSEYNLIYVGTYDDVTGKFDLIEPNVIMDCSVFNELHKEEKNNA